MRLPAAALGVILFLGGAGCGADEKKGAPDRLTRVVLEPTSSSTAAQLDLSLEIIDARLEHLGLDDADLQREGDRLALILPGDVDRRLPVLIRRGRLEFFDLQGNLVPNISLDRDGYPRPSLKPPKPQPKTVVVTCGPRVRYCPGVSTEPKRRYFYLIRYDPTNRKHPVPELTGDDLELKGTRQDFDPTTNEPVVIIQFTNAGAKKFEQVTLTLAERGRVFYNRIGGDPAVAFQQFAIVLDREIKSAPTIDFQENPAGIPGDHGAEITGIGSLEDARDLALILQTGALPVAFRVASKETRAR